MAMTTNVTDGALRTGPHFTGQDGIPRDFVEPLRDSAAKL